MTPESNAVVWRWRARKHISANPALAAGYERLIRGWLVYGNLPWGVMGLGILFGGVPTMFHYFNPRNGPVVLLWYGVVVPLWLAGGVAGLLMMILWDVPPPR